MSSIIRKIVCTKNAPSAIGPYSQAVAAGNTLYVSGQLGLVPETGKFAGADVEAQAHQVFRNINEILKDAGATMGNVVKTTVLLADIKDFTKVNEIYEKYFVKPYPARAAYQVAALPKEAKVEVEVIACLGKIEDQVGVRMAGSTPSSAARIRWKTLATALRTGVVDLRGSDCGVLPDTKAAKDISAMLFGSSELLIPLQQNDPPVKWLELVPLRPKWDENTDQMTAANYPHVRVYTSLSDLVSGDNTQGDKLAILSGFDNTGNVFIWPCELILGHSFFYPELYPGLYRIFDRIFQPGSVKRVCELGAGMTGLGGLSAAVSGVCLHPALNPSLVVLTDGNQRCVDSLCAIRDHQRARYRENSNGLCAPVQLEVEKLVWPQEPEAALEMTDSHFCTKYDLIIAADCFFDIRGHVGLLRLIDALLPNSKVPSAFIAIAPQRGGTLQSFIHTVQSSDGWTVDSILPEEFISEELWISLLRALPHLTREFVLDKVIGHLVVVQRV